MVHTNKFWRWAENFQIDGRNGEAITVFNEQHESKHPSRREDHRVGAHPLRVVEIGRVT
jgi:hypothetical protein